MSMLSQPDQPTATGVSSPSDAEPCRSCGSPVSREQRYCMGCGKRRDNQAVPFAESLAPETAVAAAAPTAKAAGGITPAMGAAIVAASVLFLGVGVLVGRSSYKAAPTAAVPQQVQTIAAGSGAAAGDAATADAAAGGKAATDGQAKAAAPPVLKGKAAAAVNKAINCKTPKECQEASKKIPNKFTTPGTPPPPDGKAPGGGAQGQTFQ